MGAIEADIELLNAGDLELLARGLIAETDVRRATVRALADTGSTMLVIPEALRDQLGLRAIRTRLVRLADGSAEQRPVVGPVEVHFGDRATTSSAITMPGNARVLLGVVQMEEMDLVPDPQARRLIPNPEHPEGAEVLALTAVVFGPTRHSE